MICIMIGFPFILLISAKRQIYPCTCGTAITACNFGKEAFRNQPTSLSDEFLAYPKILILAMGPPASKFNIVNHIIFSSHQVSRRSVSSHLHPKSHSFPSCNHSPFVIETRLKSSKRGKSTDYLSLENRLWRS